MLGCAGPIDAPGSARPDQFAVEFPGTNPGGLANPAETRSFFDAVIPAQLAMYGIPGATVAVVKDGALLFAEGYGVSNVETGAPMRAETLTRIGSISKLFTWTAVMQMVEQGKLDLHADVNTYLSGFEVPETFAEPITVAHLLTHTPGFEDKIYNLFGFDTDVLIPLERYVREQLPKRIYPSGMVVAYSNYGAALAGHIVAEVAGIPFVRFVEESVLGPLGMMRTSARQPLPANLATGAASGHLTTKDGRLRTTTEYVPALSAGGMHTTAPDMARFMIAHLQEGGYEGGRILQEATAQEMHRRQHASDPRLPGLTYGFMEWERNDQRILWHSGGNATFSSILMLLPEADAGLFVSYNADRGEIAREELKVGFLDHFFPTPVPVPEPLPNHAARASLFTGRYASTRTARTTVDKLIYATAWAEEVTANRDGTVTFRTLPFVEVEPYLFKQLDGNGTLIFDTDDHGRVTGLLQDYEPHEAYWRAAWHESPTFHFFVFSGCMAVFLVSLMVWAVAAIRQRRHGVVTLPVTARWARRISVAIGVLNLLFPVVVVLAVLSTMDDLATLIGSFTRVLTLPLLLPTTAAILTLSAVGFTYLAWRERYWSVLGRLHYTFVTLNALIFLGWLNYWNLLGWRF
jgi:CubicO group peptidase (beta-lactamase class C family)